ncbi:MAG TPA: hypothetical protein VIG47_02235 [Gemmatimonadaceae bacterium]|jgi:hypothetical protein
MAPIPASARRVREHRARNTVRTASLAVVGLTCTALASAPLAAQLPSTVTSTTDMARGVSCLDTVSMTGGLPKIVYIYAIVPDSSNPHTTQMADEFAQAVAQHMRTLLNAHTDTLPAGEPLIQWRGIRDHVALVVSASRSADPRFRLLAPHFDSTANALLLRAAQVAQQDGEGVFWSNDVPGDSLRFDIAFALSPQGRVGLAGSYRNAFPVFSVLSPAETLPLLTNGSDLNYPPNSEQMGATGVVVVQLQVDTTGHVVLGTIREQWPATKPRPTGVLLTAYSGFLDAVMKWLPEATFTPARIGGCPVNQLVLQPFVFDFH